MSANRDAVDRALASWNAGDLHGYLALYDSEIRLHGYSPEPMTKGQVVEFYEGIFESFGSPSLTFHQVLGSDGHVTIRFTMAGRHVAPFMGVSATGREIAIDGITILRFGDHATVRERWSTADMLGLLVQLGAVPAPA